MKKPTLNQRIWQSLIKEAQKALTQITKHTGEIFDESVFTIQQPKRVTQKAISRLRETELKFIRTKTEEVIHNLQPKEAEELTRKIRTREQYIRHPRISTTTERERHPLTPEERSARAKKAWKTRWERMTPEEQTQYRETFKERMRKGKQAKELEQQGLVPPPEVQGEYGTDDELTGIIGEPPTPEEQEEYYKETVKEVPVVTEKVIPVPMPKPVFEKSEPVKVKQGKPAASKTEVTKKASPAKVSSPVKTTVEAKNVVTQYWVQVAAYSNKKGAENARTILDENKINSDIFTYKDNKDKLFYRVRVGPYTTKSEAEYWRTRIVKIDDFAKANSYVTSTTN